MSGLDPDVLKSFDAVSDLVKQLITLSTAVIALTITFLTGVVRTVPPKASRNLKTAWVLYCLTVLFGIGAMMAIAGTLGSTSATKNIYQPNITWWVGLQVFTFMSGTGLVIAFGSASLKSTSQIVQPSGAVPDGTPTASEPTKGEPAP
jgi:hypothetical protein